MKIHRGSQIGSRQNKKDQAFMNANPTPKIDIDEAMALAGQMLGSRTTVRFWTWTKTGQQFVEITKKFFIFGFREWEFPANNWQEFTEAITRAAEELRTWQALQAKLFADYQERCVAWHAENRRALRARQLGA